jgi:hypothetical protein
MPDAQRLLILPQADQARDDSAPFVFELDFVKDRLARLPTRKDPAFASVRIKCGTTVATAAIVILWFEAFWCHCL